jgi:hypothetical protein
MKFKQSPAHYFYEYCTDKAEDKEQSKPFYLGSAVHTLVLEPENFDFEYAVKQKVDGRTKEGKFYNEKFALLSEGKIVIDTEVYEQALSMAVAVRNNAMAESLLMDNQFEKSIYFTHELTGLQCKVRPDAWLGSIVSDLKTTSDASFRAFQSSAYKYGYFLQAGMIKVALKSIGIDLERFLCIAVENSKPYVTGIYDIDPDAIAFGVSHFDELMVKLANCYDTQSFPGFGIQALGLPRYAQYDSLLETE